LSWAAKPSAQESEQQKPQPREEAAKVVAGGGEHGVDGVAAGEVIAAHAVVFFEVADDGLDGGPSFEFTLDLRRDAALLAAREDLGRGGSSSG
jgi:hypothetical protein